MSANHLDSRNFLAPTSRSQSRKVSFNIPASKKDEGTFSEVYDSSSKKIRVKKSIDRLNRVEDDKRHKNPFYDIAMFSKVDANNPSVQKLKKELDQQIGMIMPKVLTEEDIERKPWEQRSKTANHMRRLERKKLLDKDHGLSPDFVESVKN